MTRPAKALFALVAVAALAALLVNQRLKDAPAYLRRVRVTASFTPNGDRHRDVAGIRFVLGERDDVRVAILDTRGDVVRHLRAAPDRPARLPLRFRWGGRTDAGAAAPEGSYRVRVTLGRRGRTIVLRDAIRLRVVPPGPRPATSARPAPSRRTARSSRAISALGWLALVAVALLAAGALVLRGTRARSLAMAGALVGAPVLLAAHLWSGSQLAPLREHPPRAVVAAAVAVAVLAVAGRLFARRPETIAVAAVAVMPFRIPVPIGGSTANLLVPLYVVIAVGAAAAVARWLEGRDRALAEPAMPAAGAWRVPAATVDRALAVFVVVYALQAAYSADATQALEQTIFFYVPFALLFALLVRVDWTPRLLATCLAVLVGLAALFCLVGFAEYATGHIVLSEKLMRSNTYTPYFRVNSLFFDPNVYGRFLSIVGILLAAVAAWRGDRRTVLRIGAALAVLLVALFTTRSQSSMLTLLVGLGVLVALRGGTRTVLAAGALAVVALAVVLIARPQVFGLSSDNAAEVRKATSGRSDLLSGGARLFRERPVAGWGSGSSTAEFRRQINGGRFDVVAASHTIPMTVAVEQGVIGLAVYLALLAVAFAVLLRRARDALPRAALAAAFVALVFHTLLYASFLEDPMAWAILAVAAALAARVPAAASAEARTPARQMSSSATTSVAPTFRKSV